MKTVNDYLVWLDKLEMESAEKKSKRCLNKFKKYLTALVNNNTAYNEDTVIIRQLDIMRDKIENDHTLTYGAVEFAYKIISNLAIKSFGLVKRNYYRDFWTGIGMAIGLTMAITAFSITNEMVFLGIGLPVGYFIGFLIGIPLDKKAKRENRLLAVE